MKSDSSLDLFVNTVFLALRISSRCEVHAGLGFQLTIQCDLIWDKRPQVFVSGVCGLHFDFQCLWTRKSIC